MAKQIKAIKCPHCSSVEKTKLDKDLYHCESCNTDYFLDNDDININVNNRVEYGSNNRSNVAKNKTLPIVLTIVISLLVITYMLVSTIFNKPSHSPARGGTYSVGTTTTSPTVQSPPKVDSTPKPLSYKQQSKVYFTFTTADGLLYSFDLHHRSFAKKESLNGYYYEVRNIMTGEIIKRELLQPAKSDTATWRAFLFNGNFNYLTYDDSTIYQFDADNLSMPNVTETFFAENKDKFMSGIAVMDRSTYGIEQGIYILTNNGKEYLYYPQTQKLFPFNSYDGNAAAKQYEAETFQSTTTANSTLEKTDYKFVHLDGSRASAPTLIKVVYKKQDEAVGDNAGYTLSILHPSDRQASGKAYKITPRNGVDIVEDKILAEDRTFFSPELIYSNQDQLIIKVKNTASPTADYNLQSLDLNTGDVKWTLKGNDDLHFYYLNENNAEKYLLRYQDNYILPVDNYIAKSTIGGKYVIISQVTGKTKVVHYQPEEIFE